MKSVFRRAKNNVVLCACLLSLGFGASIFAAEKDVATAGNSHVLCKKYLSTEGGPLEAPADFLLKLGPYLQVLHDVQKPRVMTWPSDSIAPDKIADVPRLLALVPALRDPNSRLNKELNEHIKSLGGIESPKLWDAYLAAYDKTAAFSEGLMTLAMATDEILPRAGVIADLGAGTGSFSTILTMLAPKRKLRVLDFSSGGLELARAKLVEVTHNDPSRFEIEQFDLAENHLAPNSLDGAVMNNVLYTLGKNKRQALKNIFAALKPGAPFVLSDVVDVFKNDLEKKATFLITAAASAIKMGAPLTEYDLALVAKINLEVLLNSKVEFISPDELKALAEESGFKVNGFYKAYYGASMFLYLTKPE